MKKTLIFLLVLVYCPLLNAQTNNQSLKNNQFGLELYKNLPKGDNNIFFSPFSVSSALAMTYAGAKNETAKQMQDVLHFRANTENFHQDFKDIYSQLNSRKLNKSIELSIANALWVDKNYKLEKQFLKTTKKYHQAEVENVSFSSNSKNACKAINKWVENKTNNKIKDLVPPSAVDAQTRLILTNAIYFYGDWETEFDKSKTYEDKFYTNKNENPQVDYMHKIKKYKYYETSDYQVVALPYKNNQAEMLIFLPKRNADLPGVEKNLTIKGIYKAMNSMQTKKVNLHIPKFKFTAKYELSKQLKKMGMTHAFINLADFSGISGNKELMISKILHKAFIEVNEKGTEAAAATAIVMREKSAPRPEKPVVFKANRPFLFLIVENSTKSFLFIGNMNNPQKEL